MRIFGKLLPVFRLTRRLSCNSVAPCRTSSISNILQSSCFKRPRLVLTTLRTFATKSGNSKFFNRKSGRSSRRLYDRKKSKSSDCLPKSSKSNLSSAKHVSNILPVAIINQNQSSAMKVLLIPINLNNDEDDSLQRTLATLSIIRDNAREIEAFTENLPNTQLIDAGVNSDGKENLSSNLPATTETSIVNEYITHDEATYWQNRNYHNDGYDLLQQPISEPEMGRLEMHDSFDIGAWNNSKKFIFAPVSPTLEDKIKALPIASMELAFEMDMTNIKNALLSASMEPSTAHSEVEGVLAQPKEIRNLKEPTLALTTCFEMVPAPAANTVPLNFNALIQGVIEIDASKISLEELKNIKVPEFNECITAIAANLCSTALQKGFPADCVLSSGKGRKVGNDERISYLRIGNPESVKNSLTGPINKAEYSTKPTEPTKRSPYIVCVREGDKGCISPGNANNPMFVPSKSTSMSSTSKGSDNDFPEISVSLMPCKIYADAIAEAAKRREAKKSSRNDCKTEQKKSGGDKKTTAEKKTDPCKPGGGKKSAASEKKDPCKHAGDQKSAAEKKKDSCKSEGDQKSAASEDKKDPCKPSGDRQKLDKKPSSGSVSKKPSCGKFAASAPQQASRAKDASKKKDPCKPVGDKKTAQEKKNDPCKTGGDKKSAAEKKKDPCKRGGDKKAAAEKKKDPCQPSGDKKKLDKKTSSGSVSKKPSSGKLAPIRKDASKKKDPCNSEGSKKSAAEKKKDPCKPEGDKRSSAEKKNDPWKSERSKKATSKKKKDPCKPREDIKSGAEKKKDPCKPGGGTKSAAEDKKDPCKATGDKKASSGQKRDPCKTKGEIKKLHKKTSTSSVSKTATKPKKNPCEDSSKKPSSGQEKSKTTNKESKDGGAKCPKAPSSSNLSTKPNCSSRQEKNRSDSDPCKSKDSSKKDNMKAANPCKSKSSTKMDTKPNCDSDKKGSKSRTKNVGSSVSKKPDPCKKSFSTTFGTTEESLFKRCYHILYYGAQSSISSLSLGTFRLFSSKDKKGKSKKVDKNDPRCKSGRRKGRKDILARRAPYVCPTKVDTCVQSRCSNPPCGQLKKSKIKIASCQKLQSCAKEQGLCSTEKHEASSCFSKNRKKNKDKKNKKKDKKTKNKKKDKNSKNTKKDKTNDRKENKILNKRKFSTFNWLSSINDKIFGRQFSTIATRNNRDESCAGDPKSDDSQKNELLRITDICQIKAVPENIPKFSEYDVLIRTDSVAISETDLHVFETGGKTCPGVTLGHDASGVIVKVGKCIHNLRPGDRVVIESGLSCGICDFCKRGEYNICTKMIFNGFLSKYQVHPADLCHKLPDSVSMEEGALAGILALGCNACYKAPIKPTSNILILGSCSTAISAALCCQAIGANRVVFACTQDTNLELIQKSFDFDCVCYEPSTRYPPLLESIHELLRGWPDVVINCAISGGTMDLSIMSLASSGTCVLAKCDTECASLNAMEVLMKNIRIVPSFRSTNMFPTALQLMECGIAPMDELICKCFKWDAAQEAFQAALHESNCGNMKVILKCADKHT